MAHQKKHVFRVTGLSKGRSDEDLEISLRNTINDHFSAEEQSSIRLDITTVPSCYEPDTERVALVRFRSETPQFLSELKTNPLGDWQMEMGDNDINV
jgi:protein SERAC1